MTRCLARFFVASLILTATVAVSAQPPPTLAPTWVKRIKSGGWLATQESGRCIIISQNRAIEVLAPSGALLWKWPYAKAGGYVSPRAVSVSPDCDVVAVGGSAPYRKTWIVHRGGTVITVETPTTPMATAFDREGKFVAIGTVGGTLQLHTLSGALQWMRVIDPATIVDDIHFADDNGEILFTGDGGGSVAIDGQVRRRTAAVSIENTRVWLRSEALLSCMSEHGKELARIAAPADYVWSKISFSRGFDLLVVAYQEPGEVWRVESYSVPPPCAR